MMSSSGYHPRPFDPPLAPDPFDDPVSEGPLDDDKSKRVKELTKDIADLNSALEDAKRFKLSSEYLSQCSDLAKRAEEAEAQCSKLKAKLADQERELASLSDFMNVWAREVQVAQIDTWKPRDIKKAMDSIWGQVSAERGQLQAKLEEWQDMGEELEWCIYDTDKKEGFIRICPMCHSKRHGKYDLHAPDCKLARLLGRE